MKLYNGIGLIAVLALGINTVQAQSFFNRSAASSRKYDSVQTILKDLAASHPQNAELVTITNSDSGLPVQGLKIGKGSVSQLIVATHHGNEYGSTEVALAAAKDFAENPVKDRTVFIVPVLNISGYNAKSRYEKASARLVKGQGTRASFDPNRDYEGPCGTEGPWHLKSTKGLAKFVADQKIVASATMHTYWPAVVYPWGNSATDYSTAYNKTFIDLANSATAFSHYQTGFSGEVIYPADGTFEDYAYWKHGVWSLLFEIGDSHYPSDSDIDQMIRVNVPGLRKMMEDAPTARAEDHRFTAACSAQKSFDPHIE